MKNIFKTIFLVLVVSSCAAPPFEKGRIGNPPTSLDDCDGLYEQEYERCIEEAILAKPK